MEISFKLHQTNLLIRCLSSPLLMSSGLNMHQFKHFTIHIPSFYVALWWTFRDIKVTNPKNTTRNYVIPPTKVYGLESSRCEPVSSVWMALIRANQEWLLQVTFFVGTVSEQRESRNESVLILYRWFAFHKTPVLRPCTQRL